VFRPRAFVSHKELLTSDRGVNYRRAVLLGGRGKPAGRISSAANVEGGGSDDRIIDEPGRPISSTAIPMASKRPSQDAAYGSRF
jgi:hypothetical protein